MECTDLEKWAAARDKKSFIACFDVLSKKIFG